MKSACFKQAQALSIASKHFFLHQKVKCFNGQKYQMKWLSIMTTFYILRVRDTGEGRERERVRETQTHTHTCICPNTNTHTCTHTHICPNSKLSHTCTHTHTHTHAHTHLYFMTNLLVPFPFSSHQVHEGEACFLETRKILWNRNVNLLIHWMNWNNIHKSENHVTKMWLKQKCKQWLILITINYNW